MTFAVIPAAGQSQRMGRPKLSLRLGGRTVIEWVIGALRDGGVSHIVVVAGPHAPELVAIADAAGAGSCLLPAATPDMRATVEHGLEWLEERFHPQPSDSWLLVPADHPTLEPEVIRLLCEAASKQSFASIWVPTYQGQRGHPVLMKWAHVAGIRASPPGQGINAYVRQHLAGTACLPVSSAAILDDLDRPEDYRHLRDLWRN
jgi:molybdenum cofactor cytidylyltransferase